MKLSKLHTFCFLVLPSFFVGLGGGILQANAAEKVVINAGIHQASIPLQDLQNFAETGEVSPALEDVLRVSQRDSEQTRKALTRQVPVDLLFADKALNHPLGGVLLDQISVVIHPPTTTANRVALRSAIVLSASEDNQVSLLEIIENYPSSELHVEGDRIVEASEKLGRLSEGMKEAMRRVPEIFR
ncbi:alpha/beta hydrolase [Ancylothrix sp. C2]|uniref:alpha/beta hydrolase n=1 Tax=Ancylothrix sp. D3o TaxID=2953691 RepID=UPI0021BAA245|nr:alpha/beta hydrolase [Ancylothrix sp. D3o]MCT7951707.1 alpha/beta hydrolase [Ancylothrix sp. D3o]